MRSGVISSAVEQTLTAEAAAVLKHSLSLARRRGHAHLTPLHVAATLLSSSSSSSSSYNSRSSLFRRACLNSTSHTCPTSNLLTSQYPLQCRALEFCFNVALNRLPTTTTTSSTNTSTITLHHFPSLSNALIAALKRAQAHQRRGSIEQHQHHHQQPPLLAIKVELESLIISILDDPSVSRVMREAGFSSTAVKNNLEDTASFISSSSTASASVFGHYYSYSSISAFNSAGGIFSAPCSPDHHTPTFSFHHHNPNPPHFLFSPPPKHHNNIKPYYYYPNNNNIISTTCANFVVKEEDVKLVFEVLLRNNNNSNSNNNNMMNVKKRNTVIVGDSAAASEGLIMEVMRRFEKGEVPHQELRKTKFLRLFQFLCPVNSNLRLMKRQEVEKSLLELKTKLQEMTMTITTHHHDHQEGVIILHIGDLKWTVDDHADHGQDHSYKPVDHVVEEIAGLVNDNKNEKVWIMGSASYQTYMRCQMREPPLEIQWSLQAVSVPCSAGLGLTLNPINHHDYSSFHESKTMLSQDQLMLETKPFISKDEKMLQQNNNKGKLSFCSECSSNFDKEAHQLLLKSGHNKLPAWLQPHGTQQPLPQLDELFELKKKWSRFCHSLHQERYNVTENQSSFSYSLWPNQSNNNIFEDSNSISFVDHLAPRPSSIPRFRRQQSCIIEFNFDGGETRKHDHQRPISELGKEEKITLALGNNNCFSSSLDNEFGKVERGEMCRVLKENVPWQSETIPSIVEAMVTSESREITWLLIHGNDLIGKRRLACAVAESVLGSADNLIQLKRRGSGNIGVGSQEFEIIGVITTARKSHKKVVVLVEDIDSVDNQLMKFLCDGFEAGKFGGEVTRKDHSNLDQAIFILTKEEKIARHEIDVKNKESVVIQMTLSISEAKTRGTNSSLEVFNLDHKRKAEVSEWESAKKSKNTRTGTEKGFNDIVGLDLNVMAKDDQEEDEENNSEENKIGELSPISSDLTRETENVLNPSAFIESIENAFAFKQSPARDREMAEVFQGKMDKCFDEIIGGDKNMFSFRVEDRVIEEVCKGCGYFTNRLFEKWVKQVFEKALKMVRSSGKDKKGGVVNVRLCLGGGNLEEGLILEDGFMGSCLPNKIQLYNKD